MLVEPARREYRSWTIDSRRWKYYRPRSDDIIIATYPKCGTTWTQQIVSLLVFQTPEPKPVMQISAWIDRRFGEPIDAILTKIEAQEHGPFLKSHLPLACLPFYDEVKYIHVARDGRDACMSLHNHGTGLSAHVLEAFDKIGLEDETIGHPFPRLPEHPAEFFHQWITAEPFGNCGGPILSFLHFQRTWWEARHRPNVLFVHFNDLKADLSGEMRRIADFLGIFVPEAMWPELVSMADFDAMRRDGDPLMAAVASLFQGGSQRFFFKGKARTNDGAAAFSGTRT